MKTALSAFDLHFIVQELQTLADSKLDRLYQPEKKEFLFQFHKASIGKAMLKVILGEALFLSEYKKENPEMNHTFCLHARKLLLGARLKSIGQLDFDRIVRLVFEAKEAKYNLIFELFSKGNAIITDENEIILFCLENQLWKDRAVRPKERYSYPKKEFNFLDMSEKDLDSAVKSSKRQNIVKFLAMDLGLGGIYAEELCSNAGIDKESKQIGSKEIANLFKAMDNLRKKKLNPLVIKKDDKVIGVIPFDLGVYKDFEREEAKSFNKALDDNFTKIEIGEIRVEKSEKKAKELERISETIRMQEEQFKGLERAAEENQRKGEIIYEKYKLVEDILGQIKDARKKMSWKEIKAKLKDKKFIKKIDEEKGEITIDI